MCYVSICTMEKESLKSVRVRMTYTILRTLENGMAVLHRLYCPDLAQFLFWKLKLALKRRRCGDISTFQEQSIKRMSLVQKSVWLLVRCLS